MQTNQELIISIEVFKNQASIWLNQGSMQIKIMVSLAECLSFASWLLEEEKEAWPCMGLPLPGSKIIDYFRPENKMIAEVAFGFTGKTLKAFKFLDLEYNAKSLELKIGATEFTFLGESLNAWLQAVKGIIKYYEN